MNKLLKLQDLLGKMFFFGGYLSKIMVVIRTKP